jgi:hypothetical protein
VKIRMVLLIILLMGVATISFAQVTGDYRTIGSNTWATITNWERYNGSAWVAATAAPIYSNANVITIRNGHIITVAANVSVDQVVIEANGQITINLYRSLVLYDGPGDDVLVYGTIVSASLITREASNLTATLVFENGSKYQNTTSGIIPSATWNDGSVCEVINPCNLSGASQNFYDFIWNCPGQTAPFYINTGNYFYLVRHDFKMLSTGTSYLSTAGYSAGPWEFGFTNYIQSGGTFIISRGSVGYNINISGDMNISGGTLTAGTTISTINFNKVGTQTFTKTGSTISGPINFVVRNGSTLDIGTSILTGAGTFTLASGAGLITANIAGITTSGASGSIQVTGSRTYSSGADYIYNGTSAQVTGNGLSIANNVTINNPAGVTLTNSTTVNGVLTQTAGAITGTKTVDGYAAIGYNYINIAENGSNIGNFGVTKTIQSLFPQYADIVWSITGTYTGGNKIVTFYWTAAEDNDFIWTGVTPAVWKGGVRYVASSYDVTSETRYITVSIPSPLTAGDYVIGQANGDGTLPNTRIYIDQPTNLTATNDVTLSVKMEGLNQNIRSFAINLSFDPAYLNIHDYSDFQQGSFLSSNGLTQWYVTGANGTYNITCAILGVSAGSTASGTLFNLTLTPQGSSTGVAGTNITLSDVILRSPLNQPVYVGILEDSNVVIDLTPAYANFNVFLQGTYQAGGSMSHSLESMIPLVSPYNGQSISVLPNVLPNNIVDWVYVQLRTGTTNSTTVQSANAFLLQNGSLVDVYGNPSLPFYLTSGSEYYIVIKHRNHLAVMSAVKYTFGQSPATASVINLSITGSSYGDNNHGFKQVEAGVYALYTGDADGDGNVYPNDLNDYWRIQVGSSGYKSADFNLDGNVFVNDLNDYLRLNIGVQSLVPN